MGEERRCEVHIGEVTAREIVSAFLCKLLHPFRAR